MSAILPRVLTVLLLAAGISFSGFQTVHANVSPGVKTSAILSNLVPPLGAGTTKDRVVSWEQECTTQLNAERADPANGGVARTIVNNSAYNQSDWLSMAGDPNNSNSTIVPAGTTSIDLQFNEVLFLCAIITMPDSGSTFPVAASQVSNAAGRYPNDRGPVPDDSAYNPNMASRYESHSRVYSITPVTGGSITGGVGQVFGYSRESNSRYWFANPVPFTYNLPPALRTPGTHTLRIDADIANIATYHDYGAAGTSRCKLKSTGAGANVAFNNFGVCDTGPLSFSFTYTILQPVIISCVVGNGLTVTTGAGEVGVPLSFSMRVNSGGAIPALPRNFTYTVRNPSGVSIQSGSVAAGAVHNVSNLVTVTPPVPGIYTVTWSYVAGGTTYAVNCPGSFTAAQKPYYRVYNGDVQAGARFEPNCTQVPSSYRGISGFNKGSGGSYAGAGSDIATLAAEAIYDFSSATAPGGPVPPDGLSFGNDDLLLAFGGDYQSEPCVKDFWSLASGVVSGAPYHVNTGGSPLNVNSSRDIFVNGNAYIENNVLITGSGSWSLSTIPYFRLIVSGGNIFIKNTVTQLDGLYIAIPNSANVGGTIYTCSLNGGVPTEAEIANSCGTKLTVNGGFIASKVKLLRTYRTLSQAGSPQDDTPGASNAAEVFVYTPEVWLATPETVPPETIKYDSLSNQPGIL